jgi:hypothetical protein
MPRRILTEEEKKVKTKQKIYAKDSTKFQLPRRGTDTNFKVYILFT